MEVIIMDIIMDAMMLKTGLYILGAVSGTGIMTSMILLAVESITTTLTSGAY